MLRILPLLLLAAQVRGYAIGSAQVRGYAIGSAAPRCRPVACNLQTVEDNAALEALIGQTANSNAIVVVHFEDPGEPAESGSWDTPSWESSSFQPQESFASGLVRRVAETYSTSSLYGGAPLICLQIDRDVGATICSTRGIVNFPTTQIWRRGTCKEVSSVELEKTLLSLGVASASKSFKKGPQSNRVGREVDDIDFTGGAGGRALFEKGDRGTTGRFSGFGDGSSAPRSGRNAPKKPGDFGYKPGDNKEWLDNL